MLKVIDETFTGGSDKRRFTVESDVDSKTTIDELFIYGGIENVHVCDTSVSSMVLIFPVLRFRKIFSLIVVWKPYK